MSEIVVLQFGDSANSVGSHFWNLQVGVIIDFDFLLV